MRDSDDRNVLNEYQAQYPHVEIAKTMKARHKKYQLMTETFNIKGPFGKGLGIRPTGVHVAFAAGTSVLIWLDLVSRIILHNTGVRSLGPDFDEEFKFILHISA